MFISLHVHGAQRQRAPFEPPETPLHQILMAIGQHRLLKRQLLLRLIGAIHPPPQPPYRRLKRLLVYTHLHGGMAIVLT